MEWITIDTLKTVGGASLAVTVVTAVIKSVIPGVTGRITQLVALGLSLVIAAVIGKWSTPTDAFITLLNACVIYAASVGIDQTINYKKTATSPTPQG